MVELKQLRNDVNERALLNGLFAASVIPQTQEVLVHCHVYVNTSRSIVIIDTSDHRQICTHAFLSPTWKYAVRALSKTLSLLKVHAFELKKNKGILLLWLECSLWYAQTQFPASNLDWNFGHYCIRQRETPAITRESAPWTGILGLFLWSSTPL